MKVTCPPMKRWMMENERLDRTEVLFLLHKLWVSEFDWLTDCLRLTSCFERLFVSFHIFSPSSDAFVSCKLNWADGRDGSGPSGNRFWATKSSSYWHGVCFVVRHFDAIVFVIHIRCFDAVWLWMLFENNCFRPEGISDYFIVATREPLGLKSIILQQQRVIFIIYGIEYLGVSFFT